VISIPDEERPWLLWSWVYFGNPRDERAFKLGGKPILHQIEDALTKAVKAATEAELGRPHHD